MLEKSLTCRTGNQTKKEDLKKIIPGNPNREELLADLSSLLSKISSLLITPKLQVTLADDDGKTHMNKIKKEVIQENKHRDTNIYEL